MTIFVTWQLIVTLDSIRNSCNVYFRYNSNDENHACYLLNSDVNTFEDAEAFCVSLGGHLASSLDEGLDIFTIFIIIIFINLIIFTISNISRGEQLHRRDTDGHWEWAADVLDWGPVWWTLLWRYWEVGEWLRTSNANIERYNLINFSWSWTDGSEWSFTNWKAGDGTPGHSFGCAFFEPRWRSSWNCCCDRS